jgi:hypothetical protein
MENTIMCAETVIGKFSENDEYRDIAFLTTKNRIVREIASKTNNKLIFL